MIIRTLQFLGLLLAPAIAVAQLASVETTIAEREQIVQQVKVSGTVTSPRTATLSAAVGGIVQQLDVDAGSLVDEGDLLLLLDPELTQVALERAQASESGARFGLEDARRRLAEAESLITERSIAKTEYDSLQSEVQMDQAALAAASAQVHEQQALLRRHQIRAPFAGVVSERLTEIGEWVNPGNPVLELVATHGLRTEFRVPQEYYGRLSADTPVTLGVSNGQKNLEGKIMALVPVTDPDARTFMVRVSSPASSVESITPGMSAEGTLHLLTGRESVVIPRDALLRYPDGRTSVWILQRQADGATVSERRVEVGLDTRQGIEIRDGLQGGEEVVTRGNESLQAGQQVSVRQGADS